MQGCEPGAYMRNLSLSSGAVAVLLTAPATPPENSSLTVRSSAHDVSAQYHTEQPVISV